MIKHWTEPNGIFLIHVPVDWQYSNPLFELNTNHIKDRVIHSFQTYDDPVGLFQLSCYPLNELYPKISKHFSNGVNKSTWKEIRLDDKDHCCHIFYGAQSDQGFIGKYLYESKYENTEPIIEQLKLTMEVLKSLTVVPKAERSLAADLDKFDSFYASLAATYDLLDSAIESKSFIEIIVISASQIDAYLRLCIVINKQLQEDTKDIDVKMFYQSDDDYGIKERKIFKECLALEIINDSYYKELNRLYDQRNRVIHRFVISEIKTRDLVDISLDYLKMVDNIRLVLKGFERIQNDRREGLFSKKNIATDEKNFMRYLYASVNDKHLINKFKRNLDLDDA